MADIPKLYETRFMPPNSSNMEKAGEALFDHVGNVEDNIAKIPGVKQEGIPDSYLPYLVWEFSLEEILPWVPNQREALKTGVKWQRLKGTPASIKIAYSWVGYEAVRIEEEVVGVHFYEVMVEMDGTPPMELVENIIALTKLSLPLRSRLTRLYNKENDFRTFRLDYSPWGDMLSDYSGVPDPGGSGVVLSFGRRIVTECVNLEESYDYYIGTESVNRMSSVGGATLDYSPWGRPDPLGISLFNPDTVTITETPYTGQIWSGAVWPEGVTWEELNTIVGGIYVRLSD